MDDVVQVEHRREYHFAVVARPVGVSDRVSRGETWLWMGQLGLLHGVALVVHGAGGGT